MLAANLQDSELAVALLASPLGQLATSRRDWRTRLESSGQKVEVSTRQQACSADWCAPRASPLSIPFLHVGQAMELVGQRQQRLCEDRQGGRVHRQLPFEHQNNHGGQRRTDSPFLGGQNKLKSWPPICVPEGSEQDLGDRSSWPRNLFRRLSTQADKIGGLLEGTGSQSHLYLFSSASPLPPRCPPHPATRPSTSQKRLHPRAPSRHRAVNHE